MPATLNLETAAERGHCRPVASFWPFAFLGLPFTFLRMPEILPRDARDSPAGPAASLPNGSEVLGGRKMAERLQSWLGTADLTDFD